MNLRDLHYLVAIAKHRHFGKAADSCFVSQPTLSTQIKKLESELGVTLIERNSKQVLLTDIGKQVVAKARDILNTADDIKQLAQSFSNPESGTLSLGVIPTLAPYLLPHIMAPLKQRFDKLRVLLYEEQTAVLVNKLNDGRLDTALMALPVEEPALQAITLFDEPFLAAIPKDSPLSEKTDIHMNDLKKETILLLDDGHCLRDQALNICREVGAMEIEGFRATSIETLRQMVASGAGSTLIPHLATMTSGNNNHIKYLPFEHPRPVRTIALFHRRSNHRIDLLNKIADSIKHSIEDLLH